jgi:hypothetical protein
MAGNMRTQPSVSCAKLFDLRHAAAFGLLAAMVSADAALCFRRSTRPVAAQLADQ